MNNNKIILSMPEGIRVWRGYRSRSFIDDREGFDKMIGGIFVPQTAQQMEPLGLAAYFPALLPDVVLPDDGARTLLPDEVALVVYPSSEEYARATSNSVAGRAYGVLHRPAFNFDRNDPDIPTSQSGHPLPWSGALAWDEPCYLVADAIDWRTGTTRSIVARPPANEDSEHFLVRLNKIIRGWLVRPGSNVNGSVICVCPDYLLYWEHRQSDDEEHSLIPLLRQMLDIPVIDGEARTVLVPVAFHEPDEGVAIRPGEFLDVRVATVR